MSPVHLPGASERMRDAGGRFPRRAGRPRRGDSAVTQPAEVHDATGENRGPLPIQGSDAKPKKTAEERKTEREAQRHVERLALVPRLLDLAGAARYLGVSPWVIRDLEHADRLKRVSFDLGDRRDHKGRRMRPGLRKLLYDVADLDQLIEQAKA